MPFLLRNNSEVCAHHPVFNKFNSIYDLGLRMARQEALLPFELREKIIEYLREDKRSLRACSLVSSQWSELARVRLLGYLTAKILSDLENPFRQHEAERLEKLRKLLEAPHSSLGRYIQEIDISGPEYRREPTLPDRYNYLISVLRTILPHLTRVCGMMLFHVDWNMIPEDVKIQLGCLVNVKYLHCYQVHYHSLDQLVLFLAFLADNYPKLQSLTINQIYVKAVSRIDLSMFAQYDLYTRLSSLRVLQIYVDQSTAPLLLSCDVIFPVQNIEELYLTIFDESTLGCVDSILRATGPTLRVLLLEMYYSRLSRESSDSELVPSLRQMVNLKSLHFGYWPDLIWVKNILRTSSAMTNLEEIWFKFYQYDVKLSMLEHLILEHKAPNIKVIVETTRWSERSDILDRLERLLPELSRRGQVYLDCRFSRRLPVVPRAVRNPSNFDMWPA